jgi:hypothetical protein
MNLSFRKHEVAEVFPAKDSKKVVTTDYLKVIDSSEIAEIEAPPFSKAQWGSEEDYKVYLAGVQPLILEYEKNGKLHSLEYNSVADIEKNREEADVLHKFRCSFLDVGCWINVEKSLAGEYRVVSNGRHRMYVARKYGFKLIVHVAQEVRGLDNL